MTLRNLARYFLYLGTTGFGGPLVLVQQMRRYFVDEKKLMTAVEFDQAFALVKAMPGPVAFQMSVFLGQRFFGFLGACVAGFSIIFPAFVMMILMGYYYDDISKHHLVAPFLDGLLFAASAVILMSLKNLVFPNRKSTWFWLLCFVGLYIFYSHLLPEPVAIILFGLLTVFLSKWKGAAPMMSVAFWFVDWQKVWELTKICVTTGAVVFGTGFALIPVLKTNLVDLHQMINIKQFNDAVVFGQMTPGPVTITATFLGYQVSGLVGAVAATCGLFFFPFLHMSTWFPHALSWLGRQKWITPFVAGATAAVVAGIFNTLIDMNAASYSLVNFWGVFLLSLAVLIWLKKTPTLALFFGAGFLNLLYHVIFYRGT